MKLYGAFQKIEEKDDGTLVVSGIASSESVDSDGEIITAAAMKAALPDYLKFGAVREMHQASAAGTAISAKVDDTGKTEFSAHVVDPIAVKKVQTGVYKGFSIGGKVLKRDADNPNTITSLRLTEISLVDRPANPDALMQLCKFDDDSDTPTISASATVASNVTVTAEEVAKGAAATTETPAAAPVKKGMYTISTLADLLTSIQWLAQDSAWEAAYEGDNSEVPAKIRAWLAQGVEILKDVVAEETSEAIAATDATGSLALADTPTDLAKKGARHSKVDAESIQAVHDHSVSLGADCGTASAEKLAKIAGPDATEALAKVATLEGEVTKLASERDVLKLRVQELEAQPEAPKGVLKIVAKGDDVAEPDKDVKKMEITEEDDALSAMKKVHAAGGVTKLQ